MSLIMNIYKFDAQKIVTEMSFITEQSVNIMDINGKIIASTDTSRIGSFHEGAYNIITKNLRELIIYNDNQYKGSKKGINLPLMLNDETIAVIGITGDYDSIIKFGQIIKKMTEILLLETYLENQRKIDSKLTRRFLRDMLLVNSAKYPSDFIKRGFMLGIDISLKRRIIAIEPVGVKYPQNTKQGFILLEEIENIIRAAFCNLNSFVIKIGIYIVAIIEDISNEEIVSILTELEAKIYSDHDTKVLIGIDDRGSAPNIAYKQAVKALNTCLHLSQNIVFYQDVTLGIFFDEISAGARHEFMQKVFKNHTKEEIDEAIPILKAYFKTNGSVSRASELLFVHKNTLQYKMNKIKEKSGYDPRLLTNSFLFYLAIYFREHEE